MNWLRRQFNEIVGLFFLSFGVTPTDEMKEQLGIANHNPKKSDEETAEKDKEGEPT